MNDDKAVGILKALADPTRLDIVRKLASEPSYVPSNEVVQACSTLTKLSQPAMSHHFGKLVDAGILDEIKVGTEKRYELNFALLTSVGINPKKL